MEHEIIPKNELHEAFLLSSKSFFIKEPLNPIETTRKKKRLITWPIHNRRL